jgi:hypothetical protein
MLYCVLEFKNDAYYPILFKGFDFMNLFLDNEIKQYKNNSKYKIIPIE